MAGKISPMMQHYLTLKEEYKDAIILYRLGDFYEMFFDDAKLASKILDLTLTGRDCGLDERAPMCGVPYHAVDGYIAKLIESGQNVAICEQLTTPDESKGMVERGVVRVITAGTVVEENILNEKKSNYLACVFEMGNNFAVAWVDVSTGEFNTIKVANKVSELEDILGIISPSEIICNEELELLAKNLQSVRFGKLPKFKKYFDWAFHFDNAYKTLAKQFKTSTLQAFEIEEEKACICASGSLMQYLNETQKRALPHINKLSLIKRDNYMVIDQNTRRNLELTETIKDKKKKGSLLNVIDKTKTNMGARMLRAWLDQPLANEKIINYRLDAVEELIKNNLLRNELDSALGEIKDIERLICKISYGSLNPRDCIALRQSMQSFPVIKKVLVGTKSEYLKKLCGDIQCEIELCSFLEATVADDAPMLLKDGNFIKNGFSKDLDMYRNLKKNGNKLISELEAREKEATDIKTLKIGYNRIFGYYIEVSNLNRDKVPIRYARKQTLANYERYITDELKRIEDSLLSADANCITIEQEIFDNIKLILAEVIPSLQASAAAISACDCLLSFAKTSLANKYSKPEIGRSVEVIEIIEGRHPVVETLIDDNCFVANDTVLDSEKNRMLVITGPNMAGKSTYMRQVALIVLLAHLGCYVPARSAKISLTDRIFTRVGASDDVAYGQSTFMVEMVEVATILQNATSKSLVILDEIGRGTSTYDGLSIAWAVLEFVADKIKSKTLFSTHYHELAELEGLIEGVKNYKVLVNEMSNSIVFLHKIARGGANKSFGIEVAALAGVPKAVTDRAKEISEQLSTVGGEGDYNAIVLKTTAPTKTNSRQMTFLSSSIAEEVVSILKDMNLDNFTPMQAMLMLSDLKEKAMKK